MKKILTITATLLLLIAFSACKNKNNTNKDLNGADVDQDGFIINTKEASSDDCFEWDSTKTEIISLTEKGEQQTILVIPEKVSELRLSKDDDTSKLDVLNHSQVRFIAFQNPDTKLRDCCFRYFKKLEHIDFPKNLKSIPSSACDGCEALKNIILPDNLENIESFAFEDCKSVKEINFNKSLKKIGMAAFSEMNLDKIELPDSIVQLDLPFESCNIKSMKIGKGLKVLGELSLATSCKIDSLELSEGIEVIEKEVFESVEIKELTIPASVHTIDDLPRSRYCKIKVVKGSEADKKIKNTEMSPDLKTPYKVYE